MFRPNAAPFRLGGRKNLEGVKSFMVGSGGVEEHLGLKRP